MMQIDCTIRRLFGKRLEYADLISGPDGRLHHQISLGIKTSGLVMVNTLGLGAPAIVAFLLFGVVLQSCKPSDPSDCASSDAMMMAMVHLDRDGLKRKIANFHLAEVSNDYDYTFKLAQDYGFDWHLKGHVDTTNIFGGPQRYYFQAVMECHSKPDGRRWRVRNLNVTG